MDILYELLDSEDLFKIPNDIKKRFAKLTLSKKKQVRKSITENNAELVKITSRNLLDELLSDDSSEGEAEAINKIFLSNTAAAATAKESSKKIENVLNTTTEFNTDQHQSTKNMTKSNTIFDDNLALSDSDATSCSISVCLKTEEPRNINVTQEEVNAAEQSVEMEKLQVTEHILQSQEDILPSSIDRLSQKLSSLGLNPAQPNVQRNRSGSIQIIDSASTYSDKETPFSTHREISDSILSISSTDLTPTKNKPHQELDSTEDYDSEIELIEISDSENDDDEHDDEYENVVSEILPSGQTMLGSTLSNTRADRLEGFLNDIENLRSNPANSFIESDESCADILHRSSADDPVPCELIKIAETSAKKVQSQPANSFIESDESCADILHRSSADDPVPCESIEIAETSAKKVQSKPAISFIESDESCADILHRSSADDSVPCESIEIAETSVESIRDDPDIQQSKNEAVLKPEPVTIEDVSPLIQGENNSDIPNSSSSDSSSSDSSGYVDHIRISTKFTINIHLSSNSNIVVRNRNAASPSVSSPPKSAQKSKNSSLTENMINSPDVSASPEPNKSSEKQSSSPNDSCVTPVCLAKTNSGVNQKLLTQDKNSVDANTAKSISEPSIDGVDDKAKEILNQLYGDQWQTPEVIRKLDKMPSSVIATKNTLPITKTDKKIDSDNTVVDFSMFHKNIDCDLESTRIKSPIKTVRRLPSKKYHTERKAKIEPQQVVSRTRAGRNIAKPNYRCSENASFTEHISDDSSIFEDSESSFAVPKRVVRQPATKNKMIYMDLSTDVVKIVDKPFTAAKPKRNDKNNKVGLESSLKSCTVGEKLEKNPSEVKTKRKLFTPQIEEFEENIPEIKNRSDNSCNSDEQIVKLKIPFPELLTTPINKNLESVKKGAPIFKLPTPKKSPSKIISSTLKENIEPSPTIKSVSTPNNIKMPLTKKNGNSRSPKKTAAIVTYGFLRSLDVCVPKIMCDPEANYFRDKFKTEKNNLAEKLYRLYNEKIFDGLLDVPMVWNKKLLNTAGRCCNKKTNGSRISKIELSEKVLTSADRLRCTLVHELCHAATWIFNGEHGHGATWKIWARKSNYVFPELPKIGVCHQYDIEYKYTYQCVECKSKSHAHSRSKKVENIRCAFCHGKIEIFLNKKNKNGEIISTPVRKAAGFAKFVKERYHIYKPSYDTHAEIMRTLGSAFGKLTVEEKNSYYDKAEKK